MPHILYTESPKLQSEKGERSQYGEKWKEIGTYFPSEVSRVFTVTCKRTEKRPTLDTQIIQGREYLKDIQYYVFHIHATDTACKIMYVCNTQITLGPYLCIVQEGPNPPSLLTGFIWCTYTRCRRGPTVLGFCLCFAHVLLICISLEIQTQDAVQTSALKMCIPSSWMGLWNNSYGLMRQSLTATSS